MKNKHWSLFPVLAIFSIVSAGCKTEAGNAGYPEFSWDHVPLYMHMRKSNAYTQEELQYLAGFPIITMEKMTGNMTYGSTEKGSLEAAMSIKQVNPDAKVLYYRNVMVHYSSYDVNESLNSIPGAFLEDSTGNTKLVHDGKREAYNLTNPAIRDWWVEHCVEMAAHPEIDGIFIDGNIKALEPEFLGKVIGEKKKQEVAEDYALMMKDLRSRIQPGKLIIANLLRARLPDAGLGYMQYFDGSYLEGIEIEANGISHLEYLEKGIDAFQKAGRNGKIICMSMGLGRALNTGLRIDDSRAQVKWGPEVQSRLEYSLAFFLICAEKYSYFLAHDGYSVNNKDSSVWMKRFPEYDRPLGPPKGPAVKDGYIYTREFEHASVWLDIEHETAKIEWK